jgi:hypothetical protein
MISTVSVGIFVFVYKCNDKCMYVCMYVNNYSREEPVLEDRNSLG